jgi:hypothetical protein
MDPHIVFDCEKVLPNRFDLAVAAAARVRALSRGGEPRSASRIPAGPSLPCAKSQRARSNRMNLHPLCAAWEK